MVSATECVGSILDSSGRLIATKYILHILKFYIFFCAVESISLIRFSWFTSLAPGS